VRTALIAVALAGVAGALAFADIYNVPPQPIRLHLTSGTPVVAVSSSVDRRFPAQRAFIQLAVVGTPVLRTPPPVAQDTHGALLVKPGVEDPTPVPLRALSAVTVNDMQLARRILLRAGIPAASLHVRSPGVADAGRGIGQILVAVEPLTDATYNALATKISGLIASYPEIEAGGLIVERPRAMRNRKPHRRRLTMRRKPLQRSRVRPACP
jgi:hypothetical protein